MKKLTLIIAIILPTMLYAQLGRDSVLMNERTMDRPIIVHDRQLRITGGYNFSTITNRFDENGDKIELSSEGRANIEQSLFIDLKYGWKEMLQLNLNLGYTSNLQREQPITIITAPPVEITETNKINGLEDLFVGLDFMVPWKDRTMDLVFSGGVTLPTSSSESDQPSHQYDESTDFITIDYINNQNRGLGTIQVNAGVQFKYRLADMAFTIGGNYAFPLDESDGRIWQHRLNSSNEFEYSSSTYTVSYGDSFRGLLQAEYQLYPWMNVFADFEYQGTSGGWSEESGNRLALPEESLFTINPGAELLLTTRFWLRQRVVFAISGENVNSPFRVETSLLYNFFPF